MIKLSSHFIGEITEQQVALEFLKLGYMVSIINFIKFKLKRVLQKKIILILNLLPVQVIQTLKERLI